MTKRVSNDEVLIPKRELYHRGDTRRDYLPHLDGIRAIALSGVLLFHFSVPGFAGGFAGVDIFLTLSGYLISRNIITSLRCKSFSLRTFYVRRFYRLHPALTATVAATTLFSTMLSPADLFRPTIKSARAALLIHANVYFHNATNYFDTESQLKPLLHTWSLSLEEHFYLVWPIVLVLFFRVRNANIVVLTTSTILIISSFGTAVFYSIQRPSFVFYELPPRMWQFLIGAMLALLQSKANQSTTYNPPSFESSIHENHSSAFRSCAMNSAREVLSIVGCLTIFLSFVLLPPGARPILIIPLSISTVTLIATPSTKLSQYVLSNILICHIGRISYAAYLTHWPIVVFGNQIMLALKQKQVHPVTLCLLTYLSAVVLHRSVEEPFRRFKTCIIRGSFLCSVALVITFCQYAIYCELPFGPKTAPQNSGFPAGWGYQTAARGAQDVTKMVNVASAEGMTRVMFGNQTSPKAPLYFIGNSYMRHLGLGINEVAWRRSLRFEVSSCQGCCIESRNASNGNSQCEVVSRAFWREIDGLPSSTAVIVSCRMWTSTPKQLVKQFKPLFQDLAATGRNISWVSNPPGIPHSLISKINACADFQLSALAQFRRFLIQQEWNGMESCVDYEGGITPRADSWQTDMAHEMFERLSPNLKFLNFLEKMCVNRSIEGQERKLCRPPVVKHGIRFGTGYRRDGAHLDEAGSYYTADAIESFLFQSVSQWTTVKS